MAEHRIKTDLKTKASLSVGVKSIMVGIGAAILAASMWLLIVDPGPTDPPIQRIRKAPNESYQAVIRNKTVSGRRLQTAEAELYQLLGVKNPTAEQTARKDRLEQVIPLLRRAEDLELRLQWSAQRPELDQADLQNELKVINQQIQTIP